MAVRTASGSYLSLPAANGGTQITQYTYWTAAAWARADASMVNLNGVVVAQYMTDDANFFLGISYATNGLTPAGRWFAGCYNTGASDWDFAIDTASHEIGKWVHIAGTFDGTTVRFYKNGKFVDEQAVVGFGFTAGDVRIGMRSSNTTDFFDGLIEDVAVWNAVLKPNEIMRLYQSGSPLTIQPIRLGGYWPLHGMGGTVSADISGKARGLTLVGSSVKFEPGPRNTAMGMTPLIAGGEVPPPGSEVHTADSRTIPIVLTVTGDEDVGTTDSNEIYVNLQTSGTEVPVYVDVATVRVTFTIDSHDCLTRWDSTQLFARTFERFEHTSNHRWRNTNMPDRFVVVAGDGLEEC